MRSTPTAALILIAQGIFAGAGLGQPPGQAGAAARPSVEQLLENMGQRQQDITSVQARLEMTSVQPDIVGASGQPVELRTSMRIVSRRTDKGESSRIDVDVQTPMAPLRMERVRTPEGMWMHQASELTGERWLKVDRLTMEKLDRAYEVLGGRGPLDRGTSRAGALLGAELIRGLGPAYDLTIGEDVKVEDGECWQVLAKLRKDAEREAQGSVPRERPDEVQVLVDKSSLLLRRLVQTHAGKPQLTVNVRQLTLNPKLDDPALFDHERLLPEGGKWVDVMQDPLASVQIREDLKRLEEIEKERAKAKDASGVQPGEKK